LKTYETQANVDIATVKEQAAEPKKQAEQVANDNLTLQDKLNGFGGHIEGRLNTKDAEERAAHRNILDSQNAVKILKQFSNAVVVIHWAGDDPEGGIFSRQLNDIFTPSGIDVHTGEAFGQGPLSRLLGLGSRLVQ
jgi:hypothetical protein